VTVTGVQLFVMNVGFAVGKQGNQQEQYLTFSAFADAASSSNRSSSAAAACRSKMPFNLSLFPTLVPPTHFLDTLRTHTDISASASVGGFYVGNMRRAATFKARSASNPNSQPTLSGLARPGFVQRSGFSLFQSGDMEKPRGD